MMRRPNKYSAKKSDCAHGHVHDSRREARRCNDLHILQRAGAISGLTIQPQFWFTIDGRPLKHENGRRVGVKLDFQYFEGDKNVCEDSKGFSVRDWSLRKAIFCALYPYVELREV